MRHVTLPACPVPPKIEDYILVVWGEHIPPKNYDFLKKAVASAIYGPGTNLPAAAEFLSPMRNHRLAA
jgi:methylmalonyl-CoA mutase